MIQFIADILTKNLPVRNGCLAIISEEGERLSYQELNEKANTAAGNLLTLGIKKGDRVALLLPNCPEFIISFFALTKIGAVPVPIGTRNRKLEIEHILSHSGAKAVISVSHFEGYNFQEVLEEITQGLKVLRYVIILNGDPLPQMKPFKPYSILQKSIGLSEWRSILKKLDAIRKGLKRDSLALMLYTSGTTGDPKGVTLSHLNVIETLKRINKTLQAKAEDVYLLVVPVTSSLGCVTTMLRAMLAGATVVLIRQFKAKRVLEVMEKERVTIEVGVPTMLVLQLMVPELYQYDLSSLRFIFMSGADCLPEVIKEIEAKMYCRVYVGYGLTESTSYVTLTRLEDPDEIRLHTVGRPIPGQKIKIVDQHGRKRKSGEVGEVMIKGCSVMLGYFKQPALNRRTIQNGWMATGDLGSIDPEGNLELSGRKKDLIIRGGFNIYPYEIENFLISHPKVQNVALVGILDKVLGERSIACIVLKQGVEASPEEFMTYCRNALADYKVPDKVVFYKELPMTPNGKVKKGELRSQLEGSFMRS